MPEQRVPQYVHVALRFWASRSDPVTVIDIVTAAIPSFGVELLDYGSFSAVTLEPGQRPVESYFDLFPKENREARVEATTGSLLKIEFRASRGSERWARPTFTYPLGMR